MTEPIDTAAVLAAHPNPSIGPEFYRLVHDLCDEIDRLREKLGTVRVLYTEKLAAGQVEHDALRAAHSALLRRLRDEMNTWRPEHPGAKECATRVLRALGDEVGD